ncbi:putative stromal membrane-associated protein [Phaeomoniella chlamydospora]|uniref:Putative stromal membrane-associated protein n=1 Tax=Phaeomoniella chlamydospora TaxID=158046 RepID=A0A0G2H6N5_PHACM|nr:putative stromal membrane-associated protein [Phaeomoniella chlamydospora]
MSRRPGADKAAANQNTIKQLLKIESNKVCADCKRNKHPRWASWNLGIFICIRCSGIHRGMGTHISRVKSVDLDAWTDEQLASVLKWGNARANKYWESKLAPGHVPSEAKIENFIRTKYESKRWVMDGPMPEPSTLDSGGDDDVPLNVVQEKAKLERAASQRATSAAAQVPPGRRQQPAIDLFGDDTPAPPVRPSTADIPSVRPQPPPQQTVAPAKQNKPGDSLLGLDFFGSSQNSAPARPSSVASTQSRPDLKQSILSLYASTPKPQSQPAPSGNQGPTPPIQNDAFGGLSDAFGGLNFSNTGTTSSPPPPKPSSAFGDFGAFSNPTSAKATPAPAQLTSPLGGGSFFDPAPPKQTTAPMAPLQSPPVRAPSNGGLDFSFVSAQAQAPAPTSTSKSAVSVSKDLFDDDFAGFTAPTPTAAPAPPPPTKISSPTPQPSLNSAFNLSNPTVPSSISKPTPAPVPAATSTSAALFDPWASADTNAWSTPEPSAPAPPPKPSAPSLGRPPAHITPNDIGGGWGSPLTSSNTKSSTTGASGTTITADEDFGGWTSAASPAGNSSLPSMMGSSSLQAKPSTTSGGFGGSSNTTGGSGTTGGTDDLFSNVWE